jgi:hypothetical protein
VQKKNYGNPVLQVRIPRPLHRNVRACARFYKAPAPVFLRELLTAICGGDPQVAVEFQTRLARGMIEHRQKELSFDGGKLVLGRPGVTQKHVYTAL